MNELAIADAIARATGRPCLIESWQAVGGGCINDTFRVTGSDHSYFVKINRASCYEMFTAEAEALEALANAQAVQVPRPVCHGNEGSHAFLVLEYLSLRPMNTAAQGLLGKQLARLHRTTGDHFGWQRDNTIGSTPQQNTPMEDWPRFYAERRLRFQLDLAAEHGLRIPVAAALCDSIDAFFTCYQPEPSLLHGDLWGGNAAMNDDGNPIVFDPACYYGDRESDVAFTELFGGFGPEFYRAYESEWPLDSGYQQRKDLYNLYHVLNHYNLFGGGYGTQALEMLNRLLLRI
ncbi:MAG: fructosamine kinase family protein [Verrucomicrobiota bacterium]